jgi:hypothetical protein
MVPDCNVTGGLSKSPITVNTFVEPGLIIDSDPFFVYHEATEILPGISVDNTIFDRDGVV